MVLLFAVFAQYLVAHAQLKSPSTVSYLPSSLNSKHKYSRDSIHAANERYLPNGLCRVSALLNTSLDQLSSYPLDIFSSFTSQEIKTYTDANKCSSRRSDAMRNSMHVCSSAARICPVQHIMLKEALSRSDTWLKGSPLAICNLHAHMLNSETRKFPINVIILGGSLTYGADGEGCHTFSPLMKCGWSFYLAMWLQYVGKGSITVFNFAIGGATSEHMSAVLDSNLDAAGLHKLGQYDIIFLDHSVNDAIRMLRSEEDVIHYKASLERLLNIFSSRSDGSGFLPLVIFLEIWPFENGGAHHMPERYQRKESVTSNNTLDYVTHQAAVAEHYHLPSWSYRDLIWKNYDGVNPMMMDYIRFKNNIRANHPPWYVHLFIADTLAALFAEVAQRCERTPAVTYQRSQQPPPLWMNLFTSRCNKSLPALIDLYAHHAKTGFLKAGSVSISLPGSWQLVEDKPTKIGWVAETNGSLALVSGALQIKASTVALGRLNLLGRKKRLPILLQVIYLRTYMNAGAMQLFLDGNHIATLDSLYPDFQTFKYSIPEPFSVVFEADRMPSELEIRWVPGNDSAAVLACLGHGSGAGTVIPATDALAACRAAVAQARTPGYKVKVTNVLLCVAEEPMAKPHEKPTLITSRSPKNPVSQ